MRHEGHRRALVEAARELAGSNLSPGMSGNLSLRVPGGFLITPSGEPYETLAPADVVFLRPDGTPGGDRLRPSTEWALHAMIYMDRAEAGAVVHVHSPYATAIACLRRDIPAFHYMVAVAGGDSIRCARYATFGTDELALAALEALEDRNACLLANHGQVAVAASLDGALRLAREVEDLAQTFSVALESGEPAILSAAEMERVATRLRDYGQRPVSRPDAPGHRDVARPTLSTARLELRPFDAGDAPRLRELAGAREVAENTLTIPHPYPEGEAEAFIAMQADAFRSGQMVAFAITESEAGLVGAIGLVLEGESGIAELGYWIGVPFWGKGYATEAAAAAVAYGFDTLALKRIWARAFARNPASSRVLEKIGMTHEGLLRRGLWKRDELLDTHMYGILREDERPGTESGRERRETDDE